MTTLDKCCRAFIVTMGVGAAYVAASEPLFVRPFGQPALVSDQAASRLAPSGFDQAQGRGR